MQCKVLRARSHQSVLHAASAAADGIDMEYGSAAAAAAY
jgi:hypothetical protein